MKVRVAADTDWLPELDVRFPGDVERVRPDAVGSPGDTDVLVVPMAAADAVLAAFDDDVVVPVVWVVPKAARRPELERLSTGADRHRFVFEPTVEAVVEACEELAPGAAPGPAPPTGAEDSMARIWEQFRGTMMERLAVLEEVGVDVLEGDAGEERLGEAHHAAHKLHGSLGTFGLHRGSELASELETLVENGMAVGMLPPGDRYRYSELVVALRRAIEAGRPAGPTAREEPDLLAPDEVAGTILIIDSDPDRLDKLRTAAAARGWRSSRGATAGEALEWLEGEAESPLLAVLDPAAGTPETLEALLGRLTPGGDPVPVIFQGRTRTLDERLQAVTLGARVFVDREASPDAVMGRADSLLATERAGEARVLAVDDDPGVLRMLTFILRGAGFTVRTLESPLEFWATLEAVEPDLILLDVSMEGVTGYQLCRAVRADSRWADLPVVFLTARSDAGDVIKAFEAGGDDFVTKPVAGPELLARIESRLARLGPAGGSVQDRETGLPSRASAMGRLETQLAVADRYEEPVTVVLVRLEGEASSELDHEVTMLADRIREEARPEDIVARWSRHEIMVARYAEDAGATHRWIERHLPGGVVRVRVGLASHPEDGDAEAVMVRATSDLAASPGQGREPGPAESGQVDADIVIVEDDEALGTLLERTLDERGYRTHWLKDGSKAAHLLTGDEPALRASLIILDVGLPGMDGLSLLRRLARDRITRRTRVLMLTARSAESEVVKALELGAFDHVPKPFSVSELLHRVRRALGDRGGA